MKQRVGIVMDIESREEGEEYSIKNIARWLQSDFVGRATFICMITHFPTGLVYMR